LRAGLGGRVPSTEGLRRAGTLAPFVIGLRDAGSSCRVDLSVACGRMALVHVAGATFWPLVPQTEGCKGA
jgi:hypothetical protein